MHRTGNGEFPFDAFSFSSALGRPAMEIVVAETRDIEMCVDRGRPRSMQFATLYRERPWS